MSTLRCDDWVEVRSAEDILATLDDKGELDGLPFMPEMLRFCGQSLRVEQSAHKTCDTITGNSLGRRMERSVHLEKARCDGSAHSGCQANCLLFWKSAWLKPAQSRSKLSELSETSRARGSGDRDPGIPKILAERTLERVVDAAEPIYRCQATRLLAATTPLAWWEPSQYARDWWSGNVSLGVLLRGIVLRTIALTVRVGRGYRIKVALYNAVARLTGDIPWPYESGRLTGPTPSERLDLEPGEWVEVKPLDEILATLNGRRNRGMGFSPEMARYCGERHRVAARVHRIIDEKTGRMIHMKNECIVLQDVICASFCSENRLFCPRRIFAYWREIWLRRPEPSRETNATTPG